MGTPGEVAMSDILRAIEAFSKSVPAGSRILDVGCGLRPYEVFFPQCTYIGIDVPVSGREASGKRPDHEFDGTNIPLQDGSFDVIICTEVLEHAVSPQLLLQEMARVSKTDALLFLTVPFIWGLHELPYDFQRYTTEGIWRAVTNAGYAIEDQRKLSPGLAAVRLLVLSEINNYKIHSLTLQEQRSARLRLLFWLQDKIFKLLCAVWRRSVKFERIYIDNLVIARKKPLQDHETNCAGAPDSLLGGAHGWGAESMAVVHPAQFSNFIEKKTVRQKINSFLSAPKRQLRKILAK